MALETRTFRQFDVKRFLVATLATVISLGSLMGLFQAMPQRQPQVSAEPQGRIIDRIEFEGLETVSPIFARSIIRTQSGDRWDQDQIARDCARLAQTGKFEGSPYAVQRDEADRLVLVFVVQERPFVVEIDFIGNQKFDADDLLGDIDLAIGSPISDFAVNQAELDIERKYREAGYYNVDAVVDRDILATERRVLFRISEGPRVKVKAVEFEGNTAFGDRELRSKIETETYIWIFRTGAFDDETAQRDAAAIKRFYIERGYLDAQVGYRIFLDDKGENLTLVFQIEEGIQYEIKSLDFAGNSVFSDDELGFIVKSAVGTPIDAEVLKLDRETLLDEYGRIGYIYTSVTSNYVFDEEEGFVNLTFDIAENQQYRVGLIPIRGNRHTQDKVIRRELRFYPDELYDVSKIKQAEHRLVETRLFSEATITPQGDAIGVRDALVDVTEADTTTILFGVGVTSNNGVVGSISIEQRNFDLFDWPRSSEEFFKGQSFRGAGQTLNLQIEPGTELTRGRIEFREPYLLDQQIGLGVGAYVFERGRDEFDEERIGFYTSFDRRFEEGFLANWTGEVAFRFEHIDISDTDLLTSREIRDDRGDSWLTSAKLTMLRDWTDSRWLPSEGGRFKVSYEQAGAFGGDHAFGKLIGEFEHYWTIHRDTFDRKHVLSFGATMGHIFGDAPVFERFFGGGIGSIRGFEFRGVSPRDGIRTDAVGGDFLALTNVQYSFPLVGDTFRGVTFLDMGTVEDDFEITDWRASVGVGVRLYLDYFGPIPIAFDLAWPIAADDDDDEQVFNFSFGTTF